MLTSNETRDKYRTSQRGTHLEEICKMMDVSGITLEELREYIDVRVPMVDKLRQHRKKNEMKRKVPYGYTPRLGKKEK